MWRRRRRTSTPSASKRKIISSRTMCQWVAAWVAGNCQLAIKSSVLITQIMQITVWDVGVCYLDALQRESDVDIADVRIVDRRRKRDDGRRLYCVSRLISWISRVEWRWATHGVVVVVSSLSRNQIIWSSFEYNVCAHEITLSLFFSFFSNFNSRHWTESNYYHWTPVSIGPIFFL